MSDWIKCVVCGDDMSPNAGLAVCSKSNEEHREARRLAITHPDERTLRKAFRDWLNARKKRRRRGE